MGWLDFFKKNIPKQEQAVPKAEQVVPTRIERAVPKTEQVASKIEQVAYCPYCKVQLEKFPTRKKKCVGCGNSYYVRTDPKQYEKVVVTEQDAKKIDKRWEEIGKAQEETRTIINFKDQLRSSVVKSTNINVGCGISLLTPSLEKWIKKHPDSLGKNTTFEMSEKEFNDLYEKVKISLREKFKFEPAEADVLWGVSNKLVGLVAQKRDDDEMRRIRLGQARFIHMRGKDSLIFQEMVQELSLKSLQGIKDAGGCTSVQVVANCCCDECKKQDGKTLTLDEARAQKILPCKLCTNKLNPDAPTGFCFCEYVPVFSQ